MPRVYESSNGYDTRQSFCVSKDNLWWLYDLSSDLGVAAYCVGGWD